MVKSNITKVFGKSGLFSVLFSILYHSNAQTPSITFTLYIDAGSEGSNFTRTIQNCTNLPSDFINQVTSVNTQGRCLQLHDEYNCTGNTIKIPARSPYHHNLRLWNFNDVAKSVQPCQDKCIPEKGKSVSNLTDHDPVQVTFYSKTDFRGKKYTYSIKGCTPLDPINSFGDRIKSVEINEGHCFLAFVDSGPNARKCVVDHEFTVFELRHGIPALRAFTEWGRVFHDDEEIIKAISPCQCKSNNATPSVPHPSENTAEKSITLYSAVNYEGSSIHILLNFTDCKDFDTDMWQWEGLAESIKLSNGACIVAYTEHNCQQSAAEVKISKSVPDLEKHNLDSRIRSIRICEEGLVRVSSTHHIAVILLPILCVVLVISVLLMGYFMRRVWLKSTAISEPLSDEEIDEFVQGLGLDLGDQDNAGNDRDNTRISSDLVAQNKPYNFDLEIERSQLRFDKDCPLGTGEFGVIYKGTLDRSSSSDPNLSPVDMSVAIKTVKPHANSQYLRGLLKEVKVMMYVGKHNRIVDLIGCCTDKLRQSELLVVMEYCEKGSLERYLKANRMNYVNHVRKGKIYYEKCEAQSLSSYVKILPQLESSIHTEVAGDMRDETYFSIKQLITWCIDVAEGMEYLALKRVIHGDLSARNVLLNKNLTGKLCDFGLSRQLYCYSQYCRPRNAQTQNEALPIPWRWTALESLKNSEFSTESDVWSYGILMWEIFTLGEQPYPHVVSLTNNFVINLEQGVRPTMPHFATSDCYNIMSSCWDEEKSRRPTFSTLIRILRQVYAAIPSPTNDLPLTASEAIFL